MGFTKRNSRPQRLPEEYVDKAIETMNRRAVNLNLKKSTEKSLPEYFRLQMRMPEWNMMNEKIKILPKKEDLFYNVINKKKR